MKKKNSNEEWEAGWDVIALVFLIFFVISIYLFFNQNEYTGKVLNELTPYKCQEMQYRITETYECEVVKSYYGELEYCKSQCDLLKAVFDYGCKHYDDCVNFSLKNCYRECEKASTHKTTCYNDTYINYSTGRYDPSNSTHPFECLDGYKEYCPTHLCEAFCTPIDYRIVSSLEIEKCIEECKIKNCYEVRQRFTKEEIGLK